MARKPPTTPPWQPERFRGLPGFAETSYWHVPPVPPLTIVGTDIHRDDGTRHMIIKDVFTAIETALRQPANPTRTGGAAIGTRK